MFGASTSIVGPKMKDLVAGEVRAKSVVYTFLETVSGVCSQRKQNSEVDDVERHYYVIRGE